MRFSGRNRFSRISLKWVGSTVGKRICSDETAGGRGVGLPVGATEAELGPGWRSSSCQMIRFSRTSIWSAGSVAARVEARARPAVDASGVAAGGAGASGLPCGGPIPSCPGVVWVSGGAGCPSIGDVRCEAGCRGQGGVGERFEGVEA